MKLSYLIKDCTPAWIRMIDPASNPRTDLDITSIHSSAQDVKPGGLFIAIKGFKADGHDYIDQALANGAAAVVTSRKIAEKNSHAIMVEVKNTRKAMSSIAARFYGNPSNSMVVTGITGTNGKTTTTWILESILKTAGHEVGVIGTVNFRYKGRIFDNPITTPESIDLHKILARMKEAGVTHVLMEVSSHAIDMHRVRDCLFDTAIFTNLTRDHLDYHKTMDAYFACKKRLFTRPNGAAGSCCCAQKKLMSVINVNNAWGRELSALLSTETTITTTSGNGSNESGNGENPKSLLSTSEVEDSISGLKGNIHIGPDSFHFKSSLAGEFNLENIICAAGAAHALGISLKDIKKGIETCQGVPGRLERIDNSGERHIFVDYAHTPDALESILKTLKMRAPARIITLFGCGGDRDNSKRPVMGEIAACYSDIIVVTSDNPRSEDPGTIIMEIMAGVEKATAAQGSGADKDMKGKKVIIEPDRAEALKKSIKLSQSGDIVIAAGKGHETYQIIHSGKIDFDDRLILKQALKDSGFAKEVQP